MISFRREKINITFINQQKYIVALSLIRFTLYIIYYTLGHSFFYRKTYALFIILVHLGSINYSSSCSTTVQSWNFCKIEIGCLIWLSKSSTRAIFFGDNYQLNHFLFWTKTFYPCVSHIPMLDVPHWMRATITRWYELLFEI